LGLMSDLKSQVADERTLQLAWKKIRHRANSRGYDDQTILDFKKNLSTNLNTIKSELLSGSYVFQKLRGTTIEKDNGKLRGLRIPAVRDRVVQKAIEFEIRKHLEIKHGILNPASFAYREGYSVKDAIEKVRSFYLKDKLKWVFVGDIQSFFDKVDTEELLNKFIFPALPDTSINKLLTDVLNLELGNRAELAAAGYSKYFPADGMGIPQGGVLSPLFANVFLSPLDQAMENKGFHLVRYADDFLVMCKTQEEANAAYILADAVLKELKLTLHPLPSAAKPGDKTSKIEEFGQQEFLGIRFNQSKIRPGTKSYREMLALLKNFNKQLPRSGLMENLQYLKMRAQAWAATYYYTDYQENFYKPLDNGLIPTVRPFREFHLKKLGLYNFTSQFNRVKSNKKEEEKK
jgi:RNA-directed DNA polymerase